MISLKTLIQLHLIIIVHAIDLDHAIPPASLPPSAGGVVAPAPFEAAQPLPILVVSKAGPYKTVKQALVAASKYAVGKRVVIRVKSGEYNEAVWVTRPYVTVIGDGAGKTIITGSKSIAGGLGTFQTATFSVGKSGTGFKAVGVTFRNTFVGRPAVAFQSLADKTVLYKCNMEGFQDTVDVMGGRHLYRECTISGAVDFIFGFGAAVFQNCDIQLRRDTSLVYVTAQGKESTANKTSGFVFHNSTVRASPGLSPVPKQVYLGRPWKPYAMVVFLKSHLDALISPAGWALWSPAVKKIPNTVYFGEYLNNGPGADVSRRTIWPGLHLLTSYAEASQFSVRRFLLADGDWLSSFGVPFNPNI